MNPIDEKLQRLFRAAAQAQSAPESEPAYGLETRVLAAWRSAPVTSAWESGVLVRGLLLASVVMVLSLLSLANGSASTSSSYSDDLALADSTVQLDSEY